MSRSDELFERAVKVIPGGVNSPVRAYGSVGMTPRFIEGASGPYVVDADSKKYIDYISSWGPMILGHNNQEVLNAVIRKAGQFRNRSRDECDPCRQRLYRKK